MSVIHAPQILCNTLGYSATWNNKTLIMFDELVSNVNNSNIPDDF